MAVSRSVLLALLGAVLMAATFMATRNTSTDATTASTPAPAKPAATKPAGTDEAAAKPSTTESKPAKDSAPAEKKEPAAAAKKAASSNTGSRNGLPLGVARAISRRDTVVLLFSQTGADDAATRDSVRAIRGERNVAVFIEDLKRLGDYRRIVSGLNITGAPTVVIVGFDKRARVIEGFVDEGSLRQHVRDVR